MNDMNKNVILNQRFEKAEAAKFKFQRQRQQGVQLQQLKYKEDSDESSQEDRRKSDDLRSESSSYSDKPKDRRLKKADTRKG